MTEDQLRTAVCCDLCRLAGHCLRNATPHHCPVHMVDLEEART